mmetsp:Transcript_25372/g.35363  ORF Transcript_25372/g.35363 Transcript_25372/m.35363 type:complete len:144 (+) Transcript_25372:85-516(+)|eukprot:CAMPEP_0184478436 /NCGR_PEP_ID=MMETSP0113_2-20130426/470_1 /TAXON_ID=91329 /ORGANISM="Norrisiella sphaerica, Strain BC52" /LENGTH=143 /DNA_ID=CAMNT_0026856233 /DNA_START=86 /DNA_END=517 /DNA_ORIENTATION=-
MSSGIKLDKKAVEQFEQEFKKKKNYTFMLFSLNKKFDKVVIVDKEAGDNKLNPTYEDFVKAIAVEKTPKWGVFDYKAKKKDGAMLQKPVFFCWCPDDSPVRAKMLHGSTTTTVKQKLGVDKTIQAALPNDLDEKIVKQKLGLE